MGTDRWWWCVQVILGVLQNWTADQRKIAYVEKWMTDVVKGKIFDKKRGHSGLELSKLTKEVCSPQR